MTIGWGLIRSCIFFLDNSKMYIEPPVTAGNSLHSPWSPLLYLGSAEPRRARLTWRLPVAMSGYVMNENEDGRVHV